MKLVVARIFYVLRILLLCLDINGEEDKTLDQ